MMLLFKKLFLFFAFFAVISSSAILAVPSAGKSDSRVFGSIVRFVVAKTNPVSLLSLNSSQLDQKLKKIVKVVKSSAVKVVFALKVKPSIRLKKTHSRKISRSSIYRLSKMIIKPESVAGADLLSAGSGDPGQYLFKALSFSEFATKELFRLLSWHYSGAIKIGSRLQAFHSERLTHYGKKTSDGSDRRGYTHLFGGSICGSQGFSCSKNNSTNMPQGLAEVKLRCRFYEHVRVGLFRMMPNATESGARHLVMGRKSIVPDISNSGAGFKFSNFYILSATIL